MPRLGQRRQLLLFLAAILVPYVVLVALSFRLVGQDRELREKRRSDQRRYTISRAREDLLARLNAIRRDEIRSELKTGERYRHPEVVLVAWVKESRLILPWEKEYAPPAPSSFDARLQDCERAEFGAG